MKSVFTSKRAESLLHGKRAASNAIHPQMSLKDCMHPSLFIGFRVVVALPVLLLGHMMHEINVSHDPDNDLPRLHVLVGSVCKKCYDNPFIHPLP